MPQTLTAFYMPGKIFLHYAQNAIDIMRIMRYNKIIKGKQIKERR